MSLTMSLNVNRSAAVEQIATWFEQSLPVREFLTQVDGLRDTLFDLFVSHYGDAYYAKLLFLKVSNYLVARYHYGRRHVHLASRPVTLMVDPANVCSLQCPGCVHSANKSFTRNLRWPSGMMRIEAFEQLLWTHGPFAVNTVLYNYGEPLLNKHIAKFIHAAHGHGMTTTLSTTLSIPVDVESFVKSEPEHVVLSIDGITQDTYGRFRKRGNLALVLENIRRLVEAKQRLGLKYPVLVWKFLVFAHNVHEVEEAVEMARGLGVDRIWLQRPFDVSLDDPEVQLVDFKDRIVQFSDVNPGERDPERILDKLDRHDTVERFFEEGWLQRLPQAALEEPSYAKGGSCAWLYYNVTADATGRVMPCCMSPASPKQLVYGSLNEPQDNWLSASAFAASRASFSDREAFAKSVADLDGFSPPYCAQCPKPIKMTFGTNGGIANLRNLDHKGALFGHAREFWLRIGRWDESVSAELSPETPNALKGDEAAPERSFADVLSSMRNESAYLANEAAYLALVRMYQRKKDWTNAGAAVDAGLAAFPNSLVLGTLKGNILIAAERFAEAEQVFNTLVASHPYASEGFEGLAAVATHQRQWSLALSRWEDCMAQFPQQADNFDWRLKKGNVLLELGSFKDAETEFSMLVSTAPGRPAGYGGLARAAQGRGDWQLAAERWRDCIRRFPEASPAAAWRKALKQALIKQGQHEEAECV